MNLIVDVGNTYVKFAVYKDKNLIHKVSFELSQFKKEYKILKKDFPKLKFAIISSVGRLSKKQVEVVDEDLKMIELSSNTELPFKNLYKTPKTLGVDRIALVSASVSQFTDKNVLIIDAGTCITYDFITDLPLLETNLPQSIIGDSTESSIHSGVVFGVIKEIDGVIDQYLLEYSDLTVILTGGDTKFLSNQLKNSIFANSNFLLEGLNFILDYNSK